MHVDRAVRVSNYLTLTLATACLGYAELDFLPAMPWILLVVGNFLALAFWLEGRWALPVWGANVLGLVIAAVTVIWLGRLYVLASSGVDIGTGDLPWPAALVPHVGPLLMMLLVVKALRPKRYADYWLLQTIGFLEVALACVLTGEPLFGLLLLGYLLSGLWCLMLLQVGIYKDKQTEKSAADGGAVRVPWRMLGLGRTARAAAVGGLLGLGLFLIVPRQADLRWDSTRLSWGPQSRLRTGVSGDMDLNRTGTVQVSEEEAFEVVVTEGTLGGKPKVNLSRQQRWRARTLDKYIMGRWRTTYPLLLTLEQVPLPPRNVAPQKVALSHDRFPFRLHTNTTLPELGPHQYFFSFTINRKKAGSLILGERIVLGLGRTALPVVCGSTVGLMASPLGQGPFFAATALFPGRTGQTEHPYQVLPVDPDHIKQLFYEFDGTLNPIPNEQGRHYDYVQVTSPAPPGQEGLNVPWEARDNTAEFPPAVRGLRPWTAELLKNLDGGSLYGLTKDSLKRDPKGPALQAIHHETVARALCDYLANSGEYTYSLNLRRQDRDLDPTMDFLRNTRQGHCQRFAGALALMLRSQGIPARVVLGYRGAEHRGEGRYVVRQSQAHAWVEALVPIRTLGNQKCWLTLDPTPGAGSEDAEASDLEGVWHQTLFQLRNLWQAFVVEFNPENQRIALLGLWAIVTRGTGFWVLAGVGVMLLVWGGRRFRHRADATPARTSISIRFYARLLAILARHWQLRPATGQTPREFGANVGNHLRAAGASTDLADLPMRLAARFYQIRFGRAVLSVIEAEDIDRQLDRLEGALAQNGARAGTA